MKRKRPQIKFCGITNLKDAVQAAELGVDYLGFIIYPESPRYIKPTEALKIIMVLREKYPRVSIVGVFVNSSGIEIQSLIMKLGLDIVQLSGDESSALAAQFIIPVWKTIHIENELSLAKIGQYGFLSAIHLDAGGTNMYGGSGQTFDWSLAKKAKKIKKKIVLAGGLNTKNIVTAVEAVQPWAVDIASGIESTLGKKDKVKMAEIIKLLTET